MVCACSLQRGVCIQSRPNNAPFRWCQLIKWTEDRAPGGSVPRLRAVTPSLGSELMPEADPFSFVNTDCQLFFFFSSSFSNTGNTCSSRISPLMKYSFSCRLLVQDFVRTSYRNFQWHWCSLKEKYAIDTRMASFRAELQRREEMSIFTSPPFRTLPYR